MLVGFSISFIYSALDIIIKKYKQYVSLSTPGFEPV